MKLGRRFIALGTLATLIGVCSCAGDPLPPGSEQQLTTSSTQHGEDESFDDDTSNDDIVVDLEAERTPFDRRLLGTNLPAWIGPERLADASFQAATRESGVSLLRMPGGSWSNTYDWASCELADATGCDFPGAARPTDFIDFMQATSIPGAWTVSINDSAQSAAAAVAFFNGQIDDQRSIGVDRYGQDWGTVGSWAEVRARGGNVDAPPITLWEVGNEVYGGRVDTGGDDCVSFGWEHVWTCDGEEYVKGDGEHDGFLAIREAMVAVDPSIEVGAVGTGDPAAWGSWGSEVIDSAGDALDFYVIHEYGFGESPTVDEALERPVDLWPALISGLRGRLDGTTPIAVTEYNLVSVESGDTEHTMTQALNALYVADTIGQLAVGGVTIANQWNLANGTTGSGTDYGLISLDDLSHFPAFDAMAMWSRVGEQMLSAVSSDENVHVYATRHDDGRITVLLLNMSAGGRSQRVAFTRSDAMPRAELVSAFTDDPSSAVLQHRTVEVQAVADALPVDLPPWSINALEISAP